MQTVSIRTLTLWSSLLSLATACGSDKGDSGGSNPVVGGCQAESLAAVRTCVQEVSEAHAACISGDDALCSSSDSAVAGALSSLDSAVTGACEAGDFLHLEPAAASSRLQQACQSEADKLAWRVFGGPQAAVWADAASGDQECLTTAHAQSVALAVADMEALSSKAGGANLAVEPVREDALSQAISEVEAACPDLASLVGPSPAELLPRVARQADCLVAAAAPDATGLDLSCGPSHAAFDAPRGEWTQVVVDGDTWGTLCGDGSDYAFLVRPAPEGSPIDQVLIALEGGGVCVFEDDCTARFNAVPELFSALDNTEVPELGLSSRDPAVSPFHDWTIAYLPYCNQDVFAGGGVTEDLGDLQLPRYGAVNARAAVSMLRDWMWRELDADTSVDAGFRPDAVRAYLGGFSAGGYGTLYNYAWMLDELGWPRTAAFPDAGLAIDNQEALGVRALGDIKIPIWGTQPHLPPYCFAGACALGEELARAISPRLKQVPEQQMLWLSNQRDDIQMNDAYFGGNVVNWHNQLRRTYCETRDLPGIQWYLTHDSESKHVVTIRPELWLGEVQGVVMADWMLAAMEDPDNIGDHAEEGSFVADVPGVEPFPCEL